MIKLKGKTLNFMGELCDLYECDVCGWRSTKEVCLNPNCGKEEKLKWNHLIKE